MHVTCEKCGESRNNDEVPYCQSPVCLTKSVLGVAKPPEGGIFILVEGFKYPWAGSPSPVTVDQIATFKRTVIATFETLASKPFVFVVPLFFLLPPFLKKKIFLKGARWISRIYIADICKKQLPDNEFCRSVREILRAGKKLIAELDFTLEEKTWLTGLLYSIAMILEFDGAYRLRWQDIMELLDQNKLREHPREEFLRLIRAWRFRERGGVGKKIDRFELPLKALIFLSPLFVKIIQGFLLEISLLEVFMDVGDRYWTTIYLDYDFNGQSFKQRQEWKQQEDSTWDKKDPDAWALTNVQITPNDWFYRITDEQAKITVQRAGDSLYQLYLQNKNGK